jgi:hypothetical protein
MSLGGGPNDKWEVISNIKCQLIIKAWEDHRRDKDPGETKRKEALEEKWRHLSIVSFGDKILLNLKRVYGSPFQGRLRHGSVDSLRVDIVIVLNLRLP